MSEAMVTYRGTVYPWHCDHMGHMNVMWYVGKFDEATWQLIATLGLPAERLRQDGIVMAAVEQRIEYKRELRAGDLLTIRSSVQEIGDKTVVMVHEMTNQGTGELAARTVITGICVDASTRRARSLPADIRDVPRRFAPRRVWNEGAFGELASSLRHACLPAADRGGRGRAGLSRYGAEPAPVVRERHCLGLARSCAGDCCRSLHAARPQLGARSGDGLDCISRCDQLSPLAAAGCDACDGVGGICIFPVSISGEPVFSC